MTPDNTNINIRIDSDVKAKAQEVLSQLGLDMTTAMGLFLRQLIKKNGMPFELTNETPKVKHDLRQPGYLKGKIWESENHDWFAPLEDFEE